MYDTVLSANISLRTRGSIWYSVSGYSYCSNVRYPFAYSLSRACCSCCDNSVYRVPRDTSYLCNLYGSRQFSLIQRPPYRKSIFGGFDPCACGLFPVSDVDRSRCCDKFRGLTADGRRGHRKCMIFEARSKRYGYGGGIDEAEIVLGLLTEDIGEESYPLTKETKRLVKNPLSEKGKNVEISNKYQSKRNQVDLNVLDSETRNRYELKVSNSMKENDASKEKIQQEENKEALSRNEKLKAREQNKSKALVLRKEHKTSVELEKEILLRKEYRDRQEREYFSRKEDWRGHKRVEENDELLRRAEHRQRARKDGSSCSSYYSFSSTGDHETDSEIEHTEKRFVGESSSDFRNSKNNEIAYQEVKEESQRHEDYERNHGMSFTKNSIAQETCSGSLVVESKFRKKTEKKLTDISVEEIEYRKDNNLQNQSKVSLRQESDYGNSSDTYTKFDYKKAQLTQNNVFDKERKQHERPTGEETSRQAKQLVASPDTKRDDIKTSHGSQKIFSYKGEISASVSRENQTIVGRIFREDEYRRNSVEASPEIDIRNTSVSNQTFETIVKTEENNSSRIHSSIHGTEEQLLDQTGRLMGSRGRSQQLTKRDSSLILKKHSDSVMKQENMNLIFGTSSVYRDQVILKTDKIGNEEDSRYESDGSFITHPADSGETALDEQNKIALDMPVQLSTFYPGASGFTTVDSPGIVTSDMAGEDSLLYNYAELHGRFLQKSPVLQHESYGSVESNAGQPLKLITQEDEMISASQLQNYCSKFVDRVKDRILSSELQMEKKTCETEFVLEEELDNKQDHKSLVQNTSYGSQSKKYDSGNDVRDSGMQVPSNEVLKDDVSSAKEPSKETAEENTRRTSDITVNRTGRSLWNVMADIVRLRWSSRSRSQNTGGAIGGSSSNQSMSSEAWFSGHEAEENEDVAREQERSSMAQEPKSSIQQEQKIQSKLEEDSGSLASGGHLKFIESHTPPYSVALETGSASEIISLPSTEAKPSGNQEATSSTSVVIEVSKPFPAFRLQRSPLVREISETGELSASGSGINVPLSTGSVEQSEPANIGDKLKGRKLERTDQLIKDRVDVWEEAYRLESDQRKNDEIFMREALVEAQKAADSWEVPVGAVLVHSGKIIARGYNQVEVLRDSTAHAEMICIRDASNTLRTWRLSGTTLYVTLEPCPMCAGAILQARVDTVVWGAPNKLLGADGSWIRLFPNGDNRENTLDQTDVPTAPIHPFHPKITIRRAVLASECADAMQQFFQLRRKKKDDKIEPPSPPSYLPITHHRSKFLTKMHDAFHLMFCL